MERQEGLIFNKGAESHEEKLIYFYNFRTLGNHIFGRNERARFETFVFMYRNVSTASICLFQLKLSVYNSGEIETLHLKV